MMKSTPDRFTPPSMRALCALVATLSLGACVVGPDYKKPDAPLAGSYKEMEGWAPAHPSDGQVPAQWWQSYGDTQLDALEAKVVPANQTLAQAVANYRQERALVQVARAAYFPQVAVAGSGARGNTSSFGAPTTTTRSLELDASWELDLWGKVTRQVEAADATAQAYGGLLANSQLSLQSELAIDYFQMRGSDATIDLLNQAIVAYQKALTLTQNQYKVGVAQLSDVVLAQTQLVSTQAQALDAAVQRAQLEHAIAVLTGAPPSQLTIAPNPLNESLLIPPPPIALPSTLLQRRPDIATAERQMAFANAQIGVAISAYYPTLSLSAVGGYAAPQMVSLFSAPARVWSVGASLAETLFDGGARGAQVDAARAAYDSQVANYRQTVLTAFQDVEDDLAGLRILENEYGLQASAVGYAKKAVDLQLNRYKAGTIAYTDVITAQTTLLSNQRSLVNLLSERVVYNVQLVKSLGGGWDTTQLADPMAFATSSGSQPASSAPPR